MATTGDHNLAIDRVPGLVPAHQSPGLCLCAPLLLR